MRKRKYIMNLLIAVALLGGCSESLKDTYDDHAGDGRIRYLGKCDSLKVVAGWEKLRLNWKNNVDAAIDSIKVTWSVSGIVHDSLLDKNITSLVLDHLGDGTYRVDVCGVDKEKNESLALTDYARPYTMNHESVRTFSRAITKFYKMGDNLVFFTDKWNNDMIEINLNYTDMSGNKKVLPMNEKIFSSGFKILEGVNTADSITIDRLGLLVGCPDTIRFEQIVLGNERAFTSDFKTAIQRRYGYTEQTIDEKIKFEEFIDSVRVLEFDYDMTTFEDILYCPKLEKVVLGKNRYLHDSYRLSENADQSVLYMADQSIIALSAAEKLRGLKIERYNKHYFTKLLCNVNGQNYEIKNLTEMYNPKLPELSYMPNSNIDTIKNSEIDDINFNSHVEYLTDNNPNTYWNTLGSGTAKKYELTFELKEEKFIAGFKVAQRLFVTEGEEEAQYYLPRNIIIKVSADRYIWTNVTFMEENPLGNGSGEVTLLPMAIPQMVKYIKVIVDDQVLVSNYKVTLADIVPYY